jgi:hypothetical protein
MWRYDNTTPEADECAKVCYRRETFHDAWTERFSHINDHFMGRRGLARQGIQDWFPVDRVRPKEDGDKVIPWNQVQVCNELGKVAMKAVRSDWK